MKETIEATVEKLLNSQYNFYLEEDVPFPVDLQDFPVRHVGIKTLGIGKQVAMFSNFQKWRDISVELVDTDTELVQAGQDVSETRSALVSFPEFFHSAMKSANYSDAKACEMFEIIRVSNRPALCSMNVQKGSPFTEIFNLKCVCSISMVRFVNQIARVM